jgi:exopolysaccharide biosynthesis protein
MDKRRNTRVLRHNRRSLIDQRGHATQHHKRRLPLPALLAIDLGVLALAMGIFCLYYFVLPRPSNVKPIVLTRPSVSSQPATTSPSSPSDTNATNTTTENAATSTAAVADQGMFGAKFANKFATGEPEITASSYKSKNISVTIEKKQANNITWFVADIYVRNLENFRTALAKDQYGKGITEATQDMAKRNNAIIAISGDYYGWHETGIVIRNGELYRQTPLEDVLIMNNDGSMQTFENKDFNADAVVANGAWQAWCFGPMLLKDGKPMTEFNSDLLRANPRAAIGYYEPGHYCLVVVDGRQPGYSEGITLTDFSKLFYDMGCKAAYNLDGGGTAEMIFMGEIVNQLFEVRHVSDIVYIGE